MSINLITYAEQNVLPEYDAALYNAIGGLNGIISGAEVTVVDNGLHIAAGDGVLAGRYFMIEEEQISVTLPASGSVPSVLYIHMDLSDADAPIALIAGAIPTYQYDRVNGIYDLRLARFNATPSGVTGLVMEPPKAASRVLQRNAEYSEGDVVFCPSTSQRLALLCDEGGTTAAAEPAEYKGVREDGFIADGTATFHAVPVFRPFEVIKDNAELPYIHISNHSTYGMLTLLTKGVYMISAVVTYLATGPSSNAICSLTHEGKYIAAHTYSASAGETLKFSLSGIFTVPDFDGAEELKWNVPYADGDYSGTYTLVRIA